MRLPAIGRATSLLLFTLGLVVVGCGPGSSTPPAPLAEAEIPAAFEKAFAKAKPELKELSTQVVTAVQAKDYSKAFNSLQSVAGRPDMNKEQISVITRALITVSGLLQTAQAQGDQKAAQTLQLYHSQK